jgi:hypothetical protein
MCCRSILKRSEGGERTPWMGMAPPKPSRARIPYRNAYQAYLRIILKGAVGSA